MRKTHYTPHFLAGVVLLAAALQWTVCTAAGLTVLVLDANGGAVADAVVVLQADTDAAADALPSGSGRHAVMRQRNTTFLPQVLAIQTHSRVSFPNEDPFHHHVYSFSPAKAFDLQLHARGENPEVRFDQPGLVTVGCNIHDNMQGYVFVTQSPWFVVTDREGRGVFHAIDTPIKSVTVWHYRQTSDTPATRVAPGTTDITLTMMLAAPTAPRLQPFEAGEY